MHSLLELRKLNRLYYFQMDVLVMCLVLGLYAFLEPQWLRYGLVGVGMGTYVIIRMLGIHSGKKVREGGHKQENPYRGKRLYDIPKAMVSEEVYLYASCEDNFPKGITLLKVIQIMILLCFVLMYYGDLNRVIGWKLSLLHGCFFIGWSIWMAIIHRKLEKQSSLFVDRGIWFRGRLLPYDQVKRFQIIPMKGGLRFELNTGSYFAAFRIEKPQLKALMEIVDHKLNTGEKSGKIGA